jgi:hypothetical protein
MITEIQGGRIFNGKCFEKKRFASGDGNQAHNPERRT